MCLAQGHKPSASGFEPRTSQFSLIPQSLGHHTTGSGWFETYLIGNARSAFIETKRVNFSLTVSYLSGAIFE